MSPNRLRWQCRRGTQELDRVLLAYLDSDYQHANVSEQQWFVQLLACEDNRLLAWFFSEAQPEIPELQQLVSKICRALTH